MCIVELDELHAVADALRSSSNSAASASGSWNGWPSASIIETPPSGTNSAVGPVAAESFARDPAAELRVLLASSSASA